jgi:hypothetical protein
MRGLVDPSLMDRLIKPYQNLQKTQFSKKAGTKNGFVRGFGTSIALGQSASMAASVQQSRF